MARVPREEGQKAFGWLHVHEPFEVNQNFVFEEEIHSVRWQPKGQIPVNLIYVDGQFVVDGKIEIPEDAHSKADCEFCTYEAHEAGLDTLIAASKKAWGKPRTWAQMQAEKESEQ